MGRDIEQFCPVMDKGCTSLLGEGNASVSSRPHCAYNGYTNPGDGVRPCWPRRTRAKASRERAKARAFWRGVRSAAGPPGLARDGEQVRATEHRTTTPGTRIDDMSITEFLSAAAEVKQRLPHLKSEWSAPVEHSRHSTAQHIQCLKAITDIDPGDQNCVDIAKEVMQYLRKGAQRITQLLIDVLESKTLHHFENEASVEKMCVQVERVLQQLVQCGAVRAEPPGTALDEHTLLEAEAWCYELAEVDEDAYNSMLECFVVGAGEG